MISRKASLVLLLVITAAIVLACCLLPRFPQPLTYHQFADRRGLFGIPVVDGYTSTIVAILFLGGVQLVSVGILGEYLGRVYDEVKRRPLFVVRDVYRGAPPP